MTEDNKDVDLYADLEKALAEGSEETETSVAGDQKKEDAVDTSKDNDNNGAELSEEEIAKLTPRAQKRIRDLAEQVKKLAEKPTEKEEKEETPQDDDKKEDAPHDFKDVNEFLSAVQDKDSRKLLETFYKVIKGETSAILAPVEAKNNEAKFEQAFGVYEKVDGMSDYKAELKKTFLRNPNQDIDSLFAKTVTDLTLNKIKKSEDKPSDPNRGGKVNLDELDLEGLYDALEKTRD